MVVKNFKVIHMEKPISIDVMPYFSWMIESDTPNTMQTSYKLTVTDSAGSLVYDSGIVESNRNSYIPYKGAKLTGKAQKREARLWQTAVGLSFPQTVSLKEKPVKARLYATYHGVYELYLNGRKADNRYFTPEHTVYSLSLRSISHENVCKIILYTL